MKNTKAQLKLKWVVGLSTLLLLGVYGVHHVRPNATSFF